MGNHLKLRKILKRDTDKLCIIPIDHGITVGPIGGLKHTIELVSMLDGADAIILHKGILKQIIAHTSDTFSTNFILHLSASTSLFHSDMKALISTVEDAIVLGADAVSMHVNFGSSSEQQMLKDLGTVSSQCIKWNIPLLVMVYIQKLPEQRKAEHYLHAIRVAEEFGADIVKVSLPDDMSVKDIGLYTKTKILVAGGEYVDNDQQYFERVQKISESGLKGMAVGRNVFMKSNPALVVELTKKVLSRHATADEAISILLERGGFNERTNF